MVSEKLAVDATPATEAVTLKPPAMPFAVIKGEVATPEELVAAAAVAPPPVNVPLGPLDGAVKVTVAPATGLPFRSVTVALKGAVNCAFKDALCGVPPEGTIEAGPVGAWVNVNCSCEKSKGTVRSTIIVNVLLLATWPLAGAGGKFNVSCPATTLTFGARLEIFAVTAAVADEPEFIRLAL